MNKEWSDKNKLVQNQLKKATIKDAIETLIELRDILMQEMLSWKQILSDKDYYAIPYMNANGYRSKTVAYSIWYIIRIENIVVNTLIRNQNEVFFENT